eukprot:755947-Hanusia_phi.AAC.4
MRPEPDAGPGPVTVSTRRRVPDHVTIVPCGHGRRTHRRRMQYRAAVVGVDSDSPWHCDRAVISQCAGKASLQGPACEAACQRNANLRYAMISAIEPRSTAAMIGGPQQ